jgi:hypothetical protein
MALGPMGVPRSTTAADDFEPDLSGGSGIQRLGIKLGISLALALLLPF